MITHLVMLVGEPTLKISFTGMSQPVNYQVVRKQHMGQMAFLLLPQ